MRTAKKYLASATSLTSRYEEGIDGTQEDLVMDVTLDLD